MVWACHEGKKEEGNQMSKKQEGGAQVTEDRPIHVRVAAALGWTNIHEEPIGWKPGTNKGEAMVWRTDGLPPPPGQFESMPVPRYDTDWSATGPLIEKYKIMLHADTSEAAIKTLREENPDQLSDEWTSRPIWFKGETPLLAVCALLIKLGEAGKLK
jgi:hypothetical protein